MKKILFFVTFLTFIISNVNAASFSEFENTLENENNNENVISIVNTDWDEWVSSDDINNMIIEINSKAENKIYVNLDSNENISTDVVVNAFIDFIENGVTVR